MIVKQWLRSATSRRHDTATAKPWFPKSQASRIGLLVTGGLFALSCVVAPITVDFQHGGIDLQAAYAKGGNGGGNGGNGGNGGSNGGGSSSAGTGQGSNGNGQGQGNAGQGVAAANGQAPSSAAGSQNAGRAGTHGAVIQWIVVTWPKL